RKCSERQRTVVRTVPRLSRSPRNRSSSPGWTVVIIMLSVIPRKVGGDTATPRSGRIEAARSQGAADAAFDLGALDRHLPQTGVVEGLDALAPGVDLRLVDVWRGGGVLEEQRQRQPLVHMLGGGGVGVDDLLVPDLVGVLVVGQVVVGHVRRRVVDATDLPFLADLDRSDDRVDRRGGVVDV